MSPIFWVAANFFGSFSLEPKQAAEGLVRLPKGNGLGAPWSVWVCETRNVQCNPCRFRWRHPLPIDHAQKRAAVFKQVVAHRATPQDAHEKHARTPTISGQADPDFLAEQAPAAEQAEPRGR
jgi:hypothetical protein